MLHMNADNFSVTETQCQCHSQSFKCTLFKLYFSSIQQCTGAQVPFWSYPVPTKTQVSGKGDSTRPWLNEVSCERPIKQSHSLVASMGHGEHKAHSLTVANSVSLTLVEVFTVKLFSKSGVKSNKTIRVPCFSSLLLRRTIRKQGSHSLQVKYDWSLPLCLCAVQIDSWGLWISFKCCWLAFSISSASRMSRICAQMSKQGFPLLNTICKDRGMSTNPLNCKRSHWS